MTEFSHDVFASSHEGLRCAFGERFWTLAHGRRLRLGPRAVLMGILNVTPDSFSDGGRFAGDPERAEEAAHAMVEAGAEIVDVGGESTRPGADPVSPAEEQRRVLPVIERLAAAGRCLVSVDTYRAETAALAVAAGAHIVNDVWGLQRDAGMATLAARTGVGLCIMHTGREREKLADVIDDQFAFLGRSLRLASDAGISADRIVLDPGFGFAKDTTENLRLMMRCAELHALGYPLLVGTSRKRFVRAGLRDERGVDHATAATSVLLRERGAAIFRVHDVAANRDALALVDAALAVGEAK